MALLVLGAVLAAPVRLVEAGALGWQNGPVARVQPATGPRSGAGSQAGSITRTSAADPLTVVASAAPSSGHWPLEVHFTAEVSGGVPPYTYDWALGDSSHVREPNPVVTYYGAGTAEVTLTVTDSEAATAEASLEITCLPTCQLACSAAVPPYVRLGTAAQLSARAETTECQGPVGFRWDFGDGSPFSFEQEVSHTYGSRGSYPWTLEATVDDRTCTVGRSITVDDISCTGPYDLFIPAAAHRPGFNGTSWQTDVDFLYRGLLEAHVDIALLLPGEANLTPQTTSVVVPTDRALRLTDVLGTVLPARNAALGIRFCAGRPIVNARLYTVSCAQGGSCGMYIPSSAAQDAVTETQSGVFHHLSYSLDPTTGSRTNIGLVNGSPFIVEVVIRLFGDDGSLLGTITQRLQAYEHRQLTRIHEMIGSPAVQAGWATIEVTTPGAAVHPYAMVIDNRSGDGIYMPAEAVR